MHDGKIDLVEHERFMREAIVVLAMQGVGKESIRTTGLLRCRIDSGAAPDDVRPESHIRASNISPQHIEPLVPIVEFIVIATFETGTAEPKCLEVISESGPYDRRRHVSDIRYPVRRHEFPLQYRLSSQNGHD
jgi:hypothetical protein